LVWVHHHIKTTLTLLLLRDHVHENWERDGTISVFRDFEEYKLISSDL